MLNVCIFRENNYIKLFFKLALFSTECRIRCVQCTLGIVLCTVYTLSVLYIVHHNAVAEGISSSTFTRGLEYCCISEKFRDPIN